MDLHVYYNIAQKIGSKTERVLVPFEIQYENIYKSIAGNIYVQKGDNNMRVHVHTTYQIFINACIMDNMESTLSTL
ncbi:hypothetical protein ACJX0J_030676, partial [Zea mays]